MVALAFPSREERTIRLASQISVDVLEESVYCEVCEWSMHVLCRLPEHTTTLVVSYLPYTVSHAAKSNRLSLTTTYPLKASSCPILGNSQMNNAEETTMNLFRHIKSHLGPFAIKIPFASSSACKSSNTPSQRETNEGVVATGNKSPDTSVSAFK